MNDLDIKEKALQESAKRIEELEKDEYTTIFIPNNLACFSEQIYSKYKYKENIRIILTPSK